MKEIETLEFKSEVKQLLHLVIHSLYSNKEIFLRELISNASDAADKLRFRALSEPHLYEEDSNLHVRLTCNKEKRILIVSDNGIGMTRAEVVENLGTIAKSGTKNFIEAIKKYNTEQSNLIGQFGVGFYSAFIIANKVMVHTRAAGTRPEDGVLWESSGEGNYTISNNTKKDRGTEIILFIREGEEEFLDIWRIKRIVSQYSDHIALPIEMEKTNNTQENNTYWEQINTAQALWLRNKTEISDQEYKEFYKIISSDVHDPLVWNHSHVEGKNEYSILLYIPSKMPWDIWNRENKHGLKLYVQRVFIMDDAEYFLPNYLRFVKGILDTNDLPLNISREVLQDSPIIKNIKSALTKRVLSMLDKIYQNNWEKYQCFWKEFGPVLKEGLAEDNINRDAITKLLLFASTYNNTPEQTVSLSQYSERMLKGQEKIYYIISDSYDSIKGSPHLELPIKQGIEVLLLLDRIDEWVINYLTKFNGKLFHSVNKPDVFLDSLSQNITQTEHASQNENKMKSLVERAQQYLKHRIKNIRLTNRLIDTPAIVTTEINEMTTNMSKLLSVTGQGKSIPEVKYILEINPDHKLIQLIADISNEQDFYEWIELILDQAILSERNTLDDPNKFIRRMNQLLINS